MFKRKMMKKGFIGITGAIVIIMFLLFGPALIKVWDLAFFTKFEFGDPMTIAIVAVIVFIFMLRRR